MRFLATGDIQAHNWSQFSYIRKDGMSSRLHNCLKVFEIIRHEAKKRGITKVLLNGDIIEENAYIEVGVYDAVYRELEKLYDRGLEVVINVGNHDVLLQSSRVIHSLRPFGKIARVIEKPTLVWDRLYVIPWMDPEKLKTTVHGLPSNRRYGLVLHCGVQGATTGPSSHLVRNSIKLKDVRGKDFAVVILSDYHTRQSLAKNVFYLGSPLQHTFGEIHKPCIWEIILDGPSYVAKTIYTGLPLFRRFVLRPGNTIETLRKQLPELKGNYIRVELREGADISESEIERLARRQGFLVRIEHKDNGGGGTEEKEIKTLAPEEAISRYVKSNAKEKYQSRLRKLGEKLYRGD